MWLLTSRDEKIPEIFHRLSLSSSSSLAPKRAIKARDVLHVRRTITVLIFYLELHEKVSHLVFSLEILASTRVCPESFRVDHGGNQRKNIILFFSFKWSTYKHACDIIKKKKKINKYWIRYGPGPVYGPAWKVNRHRALSIIVYIAETYNIRWKWWVCLANCAFEPKRNALATPGRIAETGD